MDDIGRRYYRTGMACYFLSGICAISISIVVSLLQDHYHLSYGFMGTMVSALSTGNMLAILTAGVLPGKLGEQFPMRLAFTALHTSGRQAKKSLAVWAQIVYHCVYRISSP